jgi:chromosome partitioning protein
MSVVLGIASHKGGAGKTTTAVTVGSYFASRRNWRVLIIDLDVQGHVDLFFKNREADDEYRQSGLMKLLLEKRSLQELVVPVRPNLDIINNSKQAVNLEQEIKDIPKKEYMLRERLAGNKYDLIILDTAPAYNQLQMVALCAADYCLIPTLLNYADITGVSGVLGTLELLGSLGAPSPAVIGALPTKYERVTVNTRDFYRDLIGLLRESNIQTLPPIPADTNLAACPGYGQTIWEYAPFGSGVRGYDTPIENVRIPNSIGTYGGYLHLVEILEVVMKRKGGKP